MILAILAAGLIIAVMLGRISGQLSALQALKRDEIAAHGQVASMIGEALHEVARAIAQDRVQREHVAEWRQERAWETENEERDEIRRVAENLSREEFVKFVAQRYRLNSDDAWVMSVLKTRDGIGLDAAITMLRQRDQKPGASASQGSAA